MSGISRTIAAITGTAAAALAASPAQAATAEILSSGQVAFVAEAGESNRVSVTKAHSAFFRVRITDTGSVWTCQTIGPIDPTRCQNLWQAPVRLTAGNGCAQVAANAVECDWDPSPNGDPRPGAGGWGADLTMNLGSHDDELSVLVTPEFETYADGVDGNDRLVIWTGGNDMLRGGAGHDTLDGGAGHDWLYAGAGADTLYGRAGTDRLFADADDGAVDNLDGGADYDLGYRRSNDTAVSVESLTTY